MSTLTQPQTQGAAVGDGFTTPDRAGSTPAPATTSLPACRSCGTPLHDGFQTFHGAPGLYCFGCEPVPAQVRPQVQALVAHCVGCNGNGDIYDRPCPFCTGRGLLLRSTPDATAAVLALYAALDAVGKAVDLTPWISDLRPDGCINVRFSYELVAQLQAAFALAMAAPAEGR